jgi:hypothetical protein
MAERKLHPVLFEETRWFQPFFAQGGHRSIGNTVKDTALAPNSFWG